jgi:hypothetical protein
MLGVTRRRIHSTGRTLFLLCDEAESLQAIGSISEAAIGRLRRALLAHDGVRTVLASGPRLWDLATGSATSPFLDGFLPPLYLGALAPDAARALVRQIHLPGDVRPDPSDAEIDAICEWSGGHPFLLQLFAKRTLEHGSVDRAAAEVAGDRSVASLFSVDLELLDDDQRGLLKKLAGSRTVVRSPEVSSASLELERLGLVEKVEDGVLLIRVPMFREWLVGDRLS